MINNLIWKKTSLILFLLVFLLASVSVTHAETYSFVAEWGSTANNGYYEYHPTSVVVDSSGNVYTIDSYAVAYDSDINMIKKFDSSGNKIAEWGPSGSGDGELAVANALALDSSNNLYVAERNRIQKFDSDGNFIFKFGYQGSDDGEFNYIRSIAVDSSGNIYVVDSQNQRIQKFDSEGNFITKWKCNVLDIAVDSSGYVYAASSNNILKYDGEGNLIDEWTAYNFVNIAVDSSDNVFIANHNIIQELDSDGTVINSWGSAGNGNEELDYIYDFATDSSGNVYAADYGNLCVKVFDDEGSFLRKWSYEGTKGGRFNRPNGIAVDASGSVYVVDSGMPSTASTKGINSRIQKFDSNGNFIFKWGFNGAGEGQFSNPTDVAVDSSGNVYVVDHDNARIQKFDSNGNFILEWGSSGHGKGEFDNPGGIAVDSSGNIYVADSGNYRVQEFDSDGNSIAIWGSQGADDGEFSSMNDVAVDSSGNIYVADGKYIQKFDNQGTFITRWDCGSYAVIWKIAIDSSDNIFAACNNNLVQKYDRDGNIIAEWGSKGDGKGEFSNPSGIAVDSSGNVYVVDSGNARIQKFAVSSQAIEQNVNGNEESDNTVAETISDTSVEDDATGVETDENAESSKSPGFGMVCGTVGLLAAFLYRKK